MNAFLSTMHLTSYSAAAYAIAWLTYLGYLGRMLLRLKQVETQSKDIDSSEVRG